MKTYHAIAVLASMLLNLTSPSTAFAFSPSINTNTNININTRRSTSTALASKDQIMSDMDIMCIANTAELCSYYEECDIEEREAILNRFQEQTDVLSERLAMMMGLTRHLNTGGKVDEGEVADLKNKILDLVNADADVDAEVDVEVDADADVSVVP